MSWVSLLLGPAVRTHSFVFGVRVCGELACILSASYPPWSGRSRRRPTTLSFRRWPPRGGVSRLRPVGGGPQVSSRFAVKNVFSYIIFGNRSNLRAACGVAYSWLPIASPLRREPRRRSSLGVGRAAGGARCLAFCPGCQYWHIRYPYSSHPCHGL